MATKSVMKNIVLKDKKLCRNFIRALENAQGKSSENVQLSRTCSDVKKDDIKKFFGRE